MYFFVGQNNLMHERRILLIEDEPSIAKPLIKLMKFRGYTLAWVQSADEALEWLQDEKPTCLLIDVMLPGMNGWEFRKKQLQEASLNSIPAIFLSADTGSGPEANKRGEIFVAKPIDLDELDRKLKSLLKD